MKYKRILPGKFISRPNRFIAKVEIGGKTDICHVKNTGRCKELLLPGAEVYVQQSDNPERKTKYDLISVYKDRQLVNMDSIAPNTVFAEWVESSGYFGEITYIKPEYTYGDSRFDFYIESGERRIFVEVKGVTLENKGIASFPDAPTERGIKHIKGLENCIKNGYEAYIFFIIQMKECSIFKPNRENHPEFADAIIKGASNGIKIKALDCIVTYDTLCIDDFVKVIL